MLRSDNPFKSYSSLHILHWPVGVLSAPTHLRVYRLSPGGISKLTRYINCMQNFRLVARSEMFYTNNMDYKGESTLKLTGKRRLFIRLHLNDLKVFKKSRTIIAAANSKHTVQ